MIIHLPKHRLQREAHMDQAQEAGKSSNRVLNSHLPDYTLHIQIFDSIRPIVVGRKNWLFSDTPDGAQASATVYSVMETAKANGLNPTKYISHLLSVLPERFAKDPKAAAHDLLPWADDVQRLCRVSVDY